MVTRNFFTKKQTQEQLSYSAQRQNIRIAYVHTHARHQYGVKQFLKFRLLTSKTVLKSLGILPNAQILKMHNKAFP